MKSSPETFAAVIRAKRAGTSDADAAAAGKISTVTLYKWLRRGRAGVPSYLEFARQFDAAEQFVLDARDAELRELIAS